MNLYSLNLWRCVISNSNICGALKLLKCHLYVVKKNILFAIEYLNLLTISLIFNSARFYM